MLKNVFKKHLIQKKAEMDNFFFKKVHFYCLRGYLFHHRKKKAKDENTESTQKQCVDEAQKETIRLIDVGPPQSIRV